MTLKSKHARSRLAVVVLALSAGAAPVADARQAYDPYGPKQQSTFTPKRVPGATRLLEVVDGTPRHEVLEPGALALSPAAASGLLSINRNDRLPVDAGLDSPKRIGTDLPVEFHYVVKFWQTYPQAKVVSDGRYRRLPGVVTDAFELLHTKGEAAPPPEVKAVLDRQARLFQQALYAHPWIQRSQGVITRTTLDYHLDSDPSGRKVYGFRMRVGLGYLGSGAGNPVEGADGRWSDRPYDWATVEVCSNCFGEISPSWGSYRGLQSMNGDILVETTDRPLWVSEFRTGEGAKITNPELYDPARPKTDIQVLVVKSPTDHTSQAALSPDAPEARAIAAAWLTDWRRLVDAANGPNAPRAH